MHLSLFKKCAFLLSIVSSLTACDRVFTEQNLPAKSHKSNSDVEEVTLEFLTANRKSVRDANATPFGRFVVDGSNLNAPARLISESQATRTHWPRPSKPQPYLIGPRDTLLVSRVLNSNGENSRRTLLVTDEGYVAITDLGRSPVVESLPESRGPYQYTLGPSDILEFITLEETVSPAGILTNSQRIQKLTLSESGAVEILGLGSVNLIGQTLDQARESIERLMLENGFAVDYQLNPAILQSKHIVLSGRFVPNGTFALGERPETLNNLLSTGGLTSSASRTVGVTLEQAKALNLFVTLKRELNTYKISAARLLDRSQEIHLLPNDIVNVETSAFSRDAKKIHVQNLTVAEALEKIQIAYEQEGQSLRLDLQVAEFVSQRAFIAGAVARPGVIPLSSEPILIVEALTRVGLNFAEQGKNQSIIHLNRDGKKYKISASSLLASPRGHYLRNGDQIEVKQLIYKPETVIIAGAVPSQSVFPISAEVRPVLSDALYTGSTLDPRISDTSQIYVIRQRDGLKAYHFDISNPALIGLAQAFELRPNDVVFVAEQPITEFNRNLQSLLVGLGLIENLANRL